MRIGPANNDVFGLLAARQASANRSNAAVGAEDGAAASPAAGSTDSASGAGYDFTNMTPREMHGVAQKLYDSGEIDLTQLLMLQTAGVPLGKLGSRGEFVPLSEAEKASYESTPRNYLEIVSGAMQFLEERGSTSDPTSGYDQWKGILAALQKSTAGVDLVA